MTAPLTDYLIKQKRVVCEIDLLSNYIFFNKNIFNLPLLSEDLSVVITVKSPSYSFL